MLHPYSAAGCILVSQERLLVLWVPTQQLSHSPARFSTPLLHLSKRSGASPWKAQQLQVWTYSTKQFAPVSTLVREHCPTKANVKKKKNQHLDAQDCAADESYRGHFEICYGCSSSVRPLSFESWSLQHIWALLNQKPRYYRSNQGNKWPFLQQCTDFNISVISRWTSSLLICMAAHMV